MRTIGRLSDGLRGKGDGHTRRATGGGGGEARRARVWERGNLG